MQPDTKKCEAQQALRRAKHPHFLLITDRRRKTAVTQIVLTVYSKEVGILC